MIWYAQLSFSFPLNRLIVKKLKEKHYRMKRDMILQQIIGSKINDPELGSSNYKDIGVVHKEISKEKRKNNFLSNLLSFTDKHVEDDKFVSRSDDIPIIFEEVFMRGDSEDCLTPKVIDITQPEQYTKNRMRIAILCHGYQGSHVDMLKLVHYLKVINPDVFYYCSRSNEKDTTLDIEAMGGNLAKELDSMLNRYHEEKRLESVSFIGHSLGGLIIRAALPKLEKYKNYMRAYISFSTPHLGVSSGDSKLIETGFSLLTSWKKHVSLRQLGFKDNDDMTKTYLYKLSQLPGLGWFRNVILVSSPQDTYSPYDSSRIQISTRNTSNLKTSQAYENMVDGITMQLTCKSLRRVDICFAFGKKNIDTFIGRAAHIAMINDKVAVDYFAYRYGLFL